MVSLIINPTAGNGRSKKVANAVIEQLSKKNIPFQALETEYPGHATQLAKQAAKQYKDGDFLLSIGGDGTFLEMLQGALGSGIPIASIPAGTGNDFLKSLQVPSAPMDALEHILQAEPRMIDVGQLNEFVFANECGTGFDVAVLDYAEKAKKYFHGLIPYLWGVIRTIFSYHPTPLKITADGKTVFSGDCLVVSIANGQYIGGGIQISPTADPQSGDLELIVVQDCPRMRMICRYLPGLLGGKILSFKDTVVHCRASAITVQPLAEGASFRVNVDGEIRDLADCAFSIQPAVLPVKM